MRSVLLLFLAAVAIGFAPRAQAGECTCPTIKAKGKGDTSCSANESGNLCTVNYNLFPVQSEQRAQQFVLRETGANSIPLRSPNEPAALQLRMVSQETGDALVHLVAVFLVVAALDQAAEDPRSVDIGLVATAVRQMTSPDVAPLVREMFGGTNYDRWSGNRPPNPGQDDSARPKRSGSFWISPGCIEYRTSSEWMMFKAAWSPFRLQPRCGS